MNQGDVDKRVKNIDVFVRSFEQRSMLHCLLIEQNTDNEIKAFHERVCLKIVECEAYLISGINLLYQSAIYHITSALIHRSPGLWAIIAAIVIAVSNIILFIKSILDFLHVVELLTIADVVAMLWPQFRTELDKIYGKVAEFSQAVGFGFDGFAHLINATQSSVTLLGGVLGKDDTWSESQLGLNALALTERMTVFVHSFESDPGYAFAALFREQDWNNKRKVNEWWSKVDTWITSTSKTVTKTVQDLKMTITLLLTVEQNLPAFIRDHIPQSVWDGINDANSLIDNTLLPAITNINRTIDQLNAQMQAERERAAALAEKLMLPGDLLAGVDDLTEANKLNQEQKIDDVTSRLYNTEANIAEEEDTDLVKYLDSIMGIISLVIEPPVYTKIEALPSTSVVWDKAEKVDRWFVGDF